MDPNTLTLLGVVIAEAAGLIALWIKTERADKKNGGAIKRSNGEIDHLRNQVLEELVKTRRERDSWQLRALQCEEEQRRER